MKSKYIFGIIVIAIGVFLLLNSTEIIDLNLGYLFRNFWPLILVFLGIVSMFNHSNSKSGGLILLTIGVLLQLRILDVFNIFEYASYWPVLLIIVGVWIMFSNRTNSNKEYNFKKGKLNLDTKDKIKTIGAFSGSDLKNVSQEFKGGSIVVGFGEVNLDLREANIAQDEITIDIVVAFGEVDIRIPEEWNIEINGVPVFGDWRNRTYNRSSNPDAPTLVVDCVIVFGEVDIKN
ncbi:LiaF transmembrane domain-containing protein [Chengkuizengella marina]|uniref:Cell wall-active antibiotics response LiaF-like C-terminal domain-containing protein n=1 Tax=Chengkuizengella marina TaxID=2507566 RepID=A0A6N9PZE4_9BACL|nr:DUF5668 domain-containing protein [Chengkuizengella marina]NBI27985.1 hypothetical protein [Chengkuizengella marina]